MNFWGIYSPEMQSWGRNFFSVFFCTSPPPSLTFSLQGPALAPWTLVSLGRHVSLRQASSMPAVDPPGLDLGPSSPLKPSWLLNAPQALITLRP